MRAGAAALAWLFAAWALHFFGLWTVSSVTDNRPAILSAAIVLTVITLGLVVLIARRTIVANDEPIAGWFAHLIRTAAVIVVLGILWQTFPAVIAL